MYSLQVGPSVRHLPESEGPGDGIIAVNHGEDSLGELVDARNLVVMLPRLLRDFQDVEPQEVTPAKKKKKEKVQ